MRAINSFLQISVQKLILILIPFIGSNIYGQSNIHVGQQSPPIHISTWIKNEPQDKNLTNKFIVLEFWATWCGPCLAAVSHMNALQEKFKRSDLYFISLTDEPVDKVQRTLNRIDFHSMVVNDLTQKTLIQFGNGKDGLDSYPLTVLIDNKGLIRWIGEPQNLTDQIIQDFLEGNPINRSEQKITDTKPKDEATYQNFKTLLADKSVPYHFSLTETGSTDKSQLLIENTIIELNAYTLKEIYTAILKNYPVVVPERYDSVRFNLLYKNLDKSSFLSRMENEILTRLNLIKVKESKSSDAYIVSIDNSEKLEKTLTKQFSSKSMADTKVIFTSFTIQAMLEELANVHSIAIQFKGNDKKKYDFIIPVDRKEATLRALTSYGLRIQNETQTIEYTTLKEKN